MRTLERENLCRSLSVCVRGGGVGGYGRFVEGGGGGRGGAKIMSEVRGCTFL